jgi:hypothetical protein
MTKSLEEEEDCVQARLRLRVSFHSVVAVMQTGSGPSAPSFLDLPPSTNVQHLTPHFSFSFLLRRQSYH